MHPLAAVSLAMHQALERMLEADRQRDIEMEKRELAQKRAAARKGKRANKVVKPDTQWWL